MTKTIATISYKTFQKNKEKIFMVLAVAVLASVCFYAFLIQKAVMNVVSRQNLTKEIASVGMEVNGLEENYFSIKNNITLEMAKDKGFKDTVVSNYISKKSLTAMASNNEL